MESYVQYTLAQFEATVAELSRDERIELFTIMGDRIAAELGRIHPSDAFRAAQASLESAEE